MFMFPKNNETNLADKAFSGNGNIAPVSWYIFPYGDMNRLDPHPVCDTLAWNGGHVRKRFILCVAILVYGFVPWLVIFFFSRD